MQGGFYQERLARRGIEVIAPSPADGATTHRMVFDELTRGIFTDASRDELIRIMRELQQTGADAVVLGCTEFILLVNQSDVSEIPLLDTMELHVEAVVRAALGAHASARKLGCETRTRRRAGTRAHAADGVLIRLSCYRF